MPFSIEAFNVSGFIIILLGANALCLLMVTKNYKPFYNKLFLLMVLFYIAHFIGILYSANVHEAQLIIERKLSLIVFPVILFSAPKLSGTEIRQILKSFVISCFGVSITCLTFAIVKYSQSADLSVFSYHSLSNNVGMHASYLSLYICFCLGIILYAFYFEMRTMGRGKKVIYTFFALLFIMMVILLSSRTQIFIMVIGITIFLIYRLGLNKSLIKLISGGAVISVLLVILILTFPKNRERFKEAINYKQEYAMDKKWGEKQMRHLIWKSSMELITEKPFIGWGTGDVQDELQRVYKQNKYISLTYFEETRFNAHNQFFETLIALGLIGLSTLLFGMGLVLKHAIKNKNHVCIIFMTAFIISCITESMLERQSGVVFFAFFNTFLLLNNVGKTEST